MASLDYTLDVSWRRFCHLLVLWSNCRGGVYLTGGVY